jgi:catechol 2,3-dioxygenase
MTHASQPGTTGVGRAGHEGVGIRAPGFRLPPATHLGAVRLQVADLDRSVAYYARVLGLQLQARDQGVAALGALGSGEPLVQLHERAGARAAPLQGRLGLYHFALLLPDRAALGRFVTHLAQLGARAGASDHLVSEALYLRDPDGLGIEVYADRPRSEWRAQDRQIRMDTTPLDVESVVAAARGEPWSGMPAGTVIGHVHLHVEDLDEAAAFYHRALGLDQVVWSYPGALFLSAGGYHHHLGVNVWAGPGALRPTDADARLLEWEIVVPAAVGDAAESLRAAGYHTSHVDDGWRVIDPWGTALRLVDAPGTRAG